MSAAHERARLSSSNRRRRRFRAGGLLAAGKLVAFPTETVYGLGADARSEHAVAAIFAAKGRPRFNPLIVHVGSFDAALELGAFDARARTLAQAFWPGPLTIVVPRLASAGVSARERGARDDCVAAEAAGGTSAARRVRGTDRSADPSLGHRHGDDGASRVRVALGVSVDLILDGGPTAHGLESTIVGLSGGHATLLRPGAIERHAIEAVVGPLARAHQQRRAAIARTIAQSLCDREALRLNATSAGVEEALLAFGAPLSGAKRTLNCRPPAISRRRRQIYSLCCAHSIPATYRRSR